MPQTRPRLHRDHRNKALRDRENPAAHSHSADYVRWLLIGLVLNHSIALSPHPIAGFIPPSKEAVAFQLLACFNAALGLSPDILDDDSRVHSRIDF